MDEASHILFARLIASPQSQVLAFFAIVTSPLTRLMRALPLSSSS